MPKTSQLQIRVSVREKRALKRLASAAGQDVSAYVLSRALPSTRLRFLELLDGLAATNASGQSYVLAELNDLLADLSAVELSDAVQSADVERLTPYAQNYVAAMVDLAAARAGIDPPVWTAAVPPLEEPRFATPLAGLRAHLLRASPVPFKRRNIFVDASIGDRV